MTRLIDTLADKMPADAWLELVNQLEQIAAAANAIDQRYHSAKVCAILRGEVGEL
jgi:hypothetical protein